MKNKEDLHVAQSVKKMQGETSNNYSLITSVLAWCGLVVVSSLYITIPLISMFAHDFHVTLAQASFASSAFSFTYAVSFLFLGTISEKYGRRQMMFYGLVALFLVSPLIGFAPNFLSLVLLRVIQGIAAATFAPAALAYIVEVYPLEKRITTIGFVSTGFFMAGIIGQVSSSMISTAFGWSYVFYLFGGLYLLSAILLRVVVPKEAVQIKVQKLSTMEQMRIIFSKRSLFFCYVVTITLLLSFVGMYTTLGSYLSQSPFLLNSNQILLIRSVGAIGMLISPFAGLLSKKFGVTRILRGGLMLSTLGLFMIGFSESIPMFICMSIIFVTGIAVSGPTLISLIGSLAERARGLGVTLYTFILFIGATLGPIVAINLMKIGSYSSTFEILAIILGVGMLSSFFIQANQNGS